MYISTAHVGCFKTIKIFWFLMENQQIEDQLKVDDKNLVPMPEAFEERTAHFCNLIYQQKPINGKLSNAKAKIIFDLLNRIVLLSSIHNTQSIICSE